MNTSKSIIPMIQDELKKFKIDIKLGSFEQIKSQFEPIIKQLLGGKFYAQHNINNNSINITQNSITLNGDIYNKQSIPPDSTKICGGTSCITMYKNNSGKILVLRSSNELIRAQALAQTNPKITNEMIYSIFFESFFENLKHFILYIIIKTNWKGLHIVPVPYGIFIYKLNKLMHLDILMEGGTTMNINKCPPELYWKTDKILQEMCIKIYEKLYLLNSRPEILEFKHNDLRMDNVIFINSEPVLIDFGLSSLKLGNSIILGNSYYNKEYPVTILEINPYTNPSIDMIQIFFNLVYYYLFCNIDRNRINKIFLFNNNSINKSNEINIFHTKQIIINIERLIKTQKSDLLESLPFTNMFYNQFIKGKTIIIPDIRQIKFSINNLSEVHFNKYMKYKLKFLNLQKKFKEVDI